MFHLGTKKPRGIRNNNPGNIRNSPRFTWLGQTGIDKDGFCVFDKPANGIRALCKQLLTNRVKHGCLSVRQQIERWAPPNENNTEAYVLAVASNCGVAANDDYELNSTNLAMLAAAIIKHENGVQPYEDLAISVEAVKVV